MTISQKLPKEANQTLNKLKIKLLGVLEEA